VSKEKGMKRLSDLQLSTPIRDALLEAHRRITSEFRVERLVLFGSLVRGESDEESDVDLLIVLVEPPTHQVRDRITSLILDINLEYGTNLSELIVDRQIWDGGFPAALPIHKEIEEEGIWL
jgi:predicted nucleotidyltransferase